MRFTDLDKAEVRNLLTADNTYGTVLHAILFLYLGDELYELDSVEIYGRIKDEIGEFMAEENESRLQAILTAIETDLFYTNPDVFNIVCNTLIEGDPGISDISLEAPSVGEVLWATYEVSLNRDEISFSPSVTTYMGRIIKSESEDMEDPTDIPYYEKMIMENINEMYDQFRRCGFKNIKIPNIL